MSCGHAGVCYGCATTVFKASRPCMECRRKIEGVCRIDPKVKCQNIIIGLEQITMVESH